MESPSPQKKLEPGVYQGTPNIPDTKKASSRPLIRTMKSDMDIAVKTQNETLVSIAIAEEKKQTRLRVESEAKVEQKTEVPVSAPRPHNRLVVIIFGLLFMGILIALYIFARPQLANINLPDISFPSFNTDRDPNTDTVPVVISLAPSLIPAQLERQIDTSRIDTAGLATDLQAEKNLELEVGMIKNIYLTQSQNDQIVPISAKRLIALTNTLIPDILGRSLENNFMLGLMGDASGRATSFLILKVSSPEAGIAGMLEWEQNLPTFFDTLFGKSAVKNENLPIKFKDKVIMGRDARVLNTEHDSIVYAFANPSTIVIAESEPILETLLLVLGTAPVE